LASLFGRYCKNIAEEVYYLYQAVDIRHDRKGEKTPPAA
jgi:hypothetical protein